MKDAHAVNILADAFAPFFESFESAALSMTVKKPSLYLNTEICISHLDLHYTIVSSHFTCIYCKNI